MKYNLLLALVATCVCAACATPRYADTNVLASKILSQRSASGVCPRPKVEFCEVDVVDESKQCRCIEHQEVFGYH